MLKKLKKIKFKVFTSLMTLVMVNPFAFSKESENQNLSNFNDSQGLNSRLQYDWKAYAGGYSYVEAQEESQVIYVQLKPNLKYQLLKDLSLSSKTSFFLSTGRSQSRFENPDFNLINILDLSLTYKPVELFSTSVGALNQNDYENPMFIYNRAFPGFKVESGFKLKKVSSFVNFQYSIPTSASLESDRTQAEKLPTLSTVGLKIDTNPVSWLNYNANMNYFKYQNLPSIVAFQSGALGNEVIGTQSSESFFAYQFEGYSLVHKLDLKYSKNIKQTFNVSIIDNLKAPQDRRRSQWLGVGFEFDLNNISLKPEVATFYAESDSVPALYSAFQYGRNNRQGMSYGFNVDFKNQGFALSLSYIETQLIQLRALQRDMNYLLLSLEIQSGIL